MADLDRELSLRVTANAAQAKAELDSLKTSTDGVVAAETQVAPATAAATGALTGQATAAGTLTAAQGAVAAALEKVNVAEAAFLATKPGTAEAAAAYQQVGLAVDELRTSVVKVQELGGPVPPGSLEPLIQYRGAVAEAGSGTQQLAVATAASVEATAGQAAAAGTAAGALTGQAAAAGALAQETRVVSIAVENARVATSEFVMALVQGGPGAEAAMRKAEAAVGLLTQKIELARAAGAPIPIDATVQLESFQRNLAQGTEALNAQAVASGKMAAAAGGHAVAQSAVTLALAEARAAFIALASAGTVGSAEWTAAMARVSVAVAAVNAQVALAQKTGGIVTAAQIAGAESYTARLATMVPALGAVGVATASTTAQKRVLSAATTQAANAMAGSTVSVGSLGGSLLRILGPVGLAATAIALLPGALEAADAGSKKLGKAIDDLRHGIDDEAFAVQKSGESMEDYEARVNRARDTREAMIRGFTAMGAGIIKESSDLNVAAAAWEIYNATKHNAIEGNEAFARSAKAMGISLIEGFESADVKVQAFFRIYDEYLGTRGPFVAQRFADENKKFLDISILKYEEFGKTIPDRLKLVMEGLDKLHERQGKTSGSAHVLADAEGRLAGAMAGVGIDNVATDMEKYGATLSRIASQDIPEFISGGHSVLATLESIRAKAVEVDIATTNAFRTGGSSQLSSGPTSGGHTSVGEPS